MDWFVVTKLQDDIEGFGFVVDQSIMNLFSDHLYVEIPEMYLHT